MPLDNFRLKATSAVSGFLRQAASTLDLLATQHQPWEGAFPYPQVFQVQEAEQGYALRYSLGDIGEDEVRVLADANTVYLNIHPNCREYVVPSLEDLAAHARGTLTVTEAELIAQVSRFADLRWDTVTTKELQDYFQAFFAREASEDFWANRARNLLGLAFDLAKEQAKLTGEAVTHDLVRKCMHLDKLVEAAFSKQLPEGITQKVELHLQTLPGYCKDDAVNGTLSPKVYEQIGYLIMQCATLLGFGEEQPRSRSYRLRSEQIRHVSNTPISEVLAKIENGQVIIKVRLLDTKIRNVPLSK